MVYLLNQKGWVPEENLFYYEALGAYHNERAWNQRVHNPLSPSVRDLVVDKLLWILQEDSLAPDWTREQFTSALEKTDSIGFYDEIIQILEPLEDKIHLVDFGGFYPIDLQYEYFNRLLGRPQQSLPEFYYWPPGISQEMDQARNQGDEELLLNAKNQLASQGVLTLLPDLSIVMRKSEGILNGE